MKQSNSQVRCPHCGAVWIVEPDDRDIELYPWPHIRCTCGAMIPIF